MPDAIHPIPASAAERRSRERTARRKTMIAAAIAVFGEKGFAEATMDEIAERAGFGKGTFYNYFDDKQALLAAAFEEAYDGLVALVVDYFDDAARVDPAPDARAVFRGFIAHLTNYFAEHHSVFVVMMKEAHRLAFDPVSSHVAFLGLQRDRVAAAIEVPLQAAMDRGELRPLPARTVAHLLMGNVQAYLMTAACAAPAGHAAGTPTETADFLTTVLFDGLLPSR
jgi:AcrR family transcriptional regulator